MPDIHGSTVVEIEPLVDHQDKTFARAHMEALSNIVMMMLLHRDMTGDFQAWKLWQRAYESTEKAVKQAWPHDMARFLIASAQMAGKKAYSAFMEREAKSSASEATPSDPSPSENP